MNWSKFLGMPDLASEHGQALGVETQAIYLCASVAEWHEVPRRCMQRIIHYAKMRQLLTG